jgi:hypothetical protein
MMATQREPLAHIGSAIDCRTLSCEPFSFNFQFDFLLDERRDLVSDTSLVCALWSDDPREDTCNFPQPHAYMF